MRSNNEPVRIRYKDLGMAQSRFISTLTKVERGRMSS